MDYQALRHEKLGATLGEDGVDLYLIQHPVNVTYLTGFTGDSSWLLLDKHKTRVVSDSRFTEQIAQECPGLELIVRPAGQTIVDAVGQVLKQSQPGSVGIESTCMTVGELESLREAAPAVAFKPLKDRVETLRAIKDANEIAQIRQAVSFAENAFEEFCTKIRGGSTEKELADVMEACVRKAGGRNTSFPTIVAAGERSALPHAPVSDKRVEDGGFLLLDWGASGRLYKSDLTRILVPRTNLASFSQSSVAKLQAVHEVVLRGQRRALELLRPGAVGHDIDLAVRGVIVEAGFGKHCYGHGLGHGLGLQVHEAPSLRPNSQSVLAPGMVVTVEPGIYIPGWGGVRLEEDVLVTADGCELLSRLPSDLTSLTYNL